MSYSFQNKNNSFHNLPNELIIYINDFLKDDSIYKTFVKSFTTYYAIFKHIRLRTHLRIYIIFSDDNSTLKILLKDPLNKHWTTTLYYFIDSDNIYIDYNYYDIIPINENGEHNITLVSYTPDEDSDNEGTINNVIIEIDSDDEDN
jgi:hypothetical protein